VSLKNEYHLFWAKPHSARHVRCMGFVAFGFIVEIGLP